MKIFRFDPQVGRSIDQYNSSGVALSRVARLFEEAVIHCAYLDVSGIIGYHQASIPQLFLVLQGEGWVRGEAPARTAIKAGQASYWEKAEWHAAGTETGLTAMIIEAVKFDLSGLMLLM